MRKNIRNLWVYIHLVAHIKKKEKGYTYEVPDTGELINTWDTMVADEDIDRWFETQIIRKGVD